MNLLKKTMSLLSVVMSGMLIISAVPQAQSNLSLSASAATTCVVNTSKTYQKIKGFGGMNLPEWAGSDLTDTQRKLAFGNGNGQLGLSIVRVYVNDDKNQWNKALATAKYAQSQGAIVFATPWNPPASMCERFSKSNDPDAKRLKKSSYAAYAQHLNDFYHYMKNNGVNLYAISIQNEPDWGSDWTWMTESECVDFLANYADKIDCPVMSPESFSYNKSYYNAILNNSKAYANTDIFGTHFYGTSRSNMDFPALENCGKEIFMTEVYVPNSTSDADTFPEALDVCENIHNGLVVGNMNAYVWWYIRRSYGLIKENSNVSKRGYCLAQYSKFVRPGDVRVDATEQPSSKVYVSAYKNSKNQVTIVAVNKSTTGYSQNFSLSSGNITDVDRYRTSSNENLALTENLASSGSSFNAQLPASSVSTFVVTLNGSSQPTTTQQTTQSTTQQTTTQPAVTPDANGYLFHSTFEDGVDDWTSRGANTLGLSGRAPFAGTNALLVSERTASWNGAQKSLSTSSFVPGNSYSFSADVNYLDGDVDSSTFYLTLQYKDSTGTTKYSNIATKTVTKGTYAQLANANYKIPDGASDMQLVVETASDTMNFYVDEIIGAKAGTVISGPVETTTAQATTQAIVTTTTKASTNAPSDVLYGDANCDGKIDISDVVTVRRQLVNGTKFPMSAQGLSNADVQQRGNGVNAQDAVTIQQKVLGVAEFSISDETTTTTTTTKATTAAPVNQWDTYVETASADMQAFYASSIYQMGNTARIRDKIAKAQSGDKVTVAYLGGSITEGGRTDTCYAARSYKYFADTFGKGSNVSYINAGMSGTSSVVGLLRSQNDILNSKPDVIFLEFSVNDHPDEIYKKGYESLVKKCLSQENQPAVIILINRSKGGYSMQEQMSAIGKNYNVPIISMDNALTKAFNSGLLTTSDYYTDEYHPHSDGCKLISDCISYFYRQALKTANASPAYTIPSTTAYGSEYSTATIVPISELSNFNSGSFSSTNGYGTLPYGYAFNKNSANTPMTFSTQGKGLFIIYKANSSGMGNINVTVNGNTSKISGNKLYTWGGPDTDLAYYQNNSGTLNVSISMENTSSDFTIWGIGIVK